MPLAKEEVNVNLSQPLNTKFDDKVLPQNFVLASENVDYGLVGTCLKRNGALIKSVSISDGGSDIGSREVDLLSSISDTTFCAQKPFYREVYSHSDGADEWKKNTAARPISYERNDVYKTTKTHVWNDSDYQTYGGKPFSCYVLEETGDKIFIILKDETTGVQTTTSITSTGTTATKVPDIKPRIRFSKSATSSISDMKIFLTYRDGANMDYKIYDSGLSVLYSGRFSSLTGNQGYQTNYDVLEDNGTLYIFALTLAGNNLVTQALTGAGVTTSTATTAVTAYNAGAFISACKNIGGTKYCVFYNENKKTDNLFNINYTDMATVADSVSTISSGISYKLRNFSCAGYTSASGDVAFIAQNQVDDPTGTFFPPEDRILLYAYQSSTQVLTLKKEFSHMGNPSKPVLYNSGSRTVLFVAGSYNRLTYNDNFHDFLFVTNIDTYFDVVATFNRSKSIGLPAKYNIAGGADTVNNNPNNLVLSGEFIHSCFLSLNRLDFDNTTKIYGTESYIFQVTARDDLRTNSIFGKCVYYPGAISYLFDGQAFSENGFLYNPTILEVKAAGSSDSLADGVYKFKAVFETQLPNGIRSQSAPSLEFSHTISGGTGTANRNVVIANYNLNQKGTNANTIVSLYATDVGGSIFYKHAESVIGTSTAPITINFGTTTGLTDNQVLYTESGELENDPCPPSNYILAAKNRLFSIDREDPNILNYSKKFIDGFEAEFSNSLNLRIDSTTQLEGAIALALLDEKIIIFKKNKIYYFTGDGPNALGFNNTFSVPELVTSEIGCSEPTSVIRTPNGIMFKSNVGIHLLDRGLNLNYIGHPVEEFNSIAITSSILMQNKNQVRFTLRNTGMLVYDYFSQKWSIYKDLSATDSTQLSGVHHYLKSSEIFYDGTGFQDDSNYYAMKVITPWLKVSGIQNFGRFWRAYILGAFKSAHELVVKTYYDYNETATDTYVLTPLITDAKYQEEIHLRIQKCEAVKFEIYDQNQSGTGESMELTDLTLLVGKKRGPNKMPSTSKQ